MKRRAGNNGEGGWTSGEGRSLCARGDLYGRFKHWESGRPVWCRQCSLRVTKKQILDVNVPSARSASPKEIPNVNRASNSAHHPRLLPTQSWELSKALIPSFSSTNIVHIWLSSATDQIL